MLYNFPHLSGFLRLLPFLPFLVIPPFQLFFSFLPFPLFLPFPCFCRINCSYGSYRSYSFCSFHFSYRINYCHCSNHFYSFDCSRLQFLLFKLFLPLQLFLPFNSSYCLQFLQFQLFLPVQILPLFLSFCLFVCFDLFSGGYYVSVW